MSASVDRRELRGWYEGDMCFAVAVTLYSSFIIARLVGYRACSLNEIRETPLRFHQRESSRS